MLMPPLIFGRGAGPFNTISIQIPSMVRGALAAKKSGMVKDCTAVWSHVHVQDLAELYKLLFTKVFIEKAGEEQVPSGKNGIYFAETGEASWVSVAEEVGKVGKELGKLKTEKLEEIDIQEAANRWTDGSVEYVEAAFLSK
jgi:nucleoside-diphosphate-sugar epimerase